MKRAPMVRIRQPTKDRLDKLRETEKGRVSYDDIINWILDQVEKT